MGAGLIKIKTKLSPQLGLAKLELGLSLAIQNMYNIKEHFILIFALSVVRVWTLYC